MSRRTLTNKRGGGEKLIVTPKWQKMEKELSHFSHDIFRRKRFPRF